MTGNLTFPKQRRLCSRDSIKRLFTNSRCFIVAPLTIHYYFETIDPQLEEPVIPCQVLMSVPKKIFKHAVDRNCVKRRLREGFRKQYGPLDDLLKQKNKTLRFICIYTSNEILDSEILERKMGSVLANFKKILEKSSAVPPAAAH